MAYLIFRIVEMDFQKDADEIDFTKTLGEHYSVVCFMPTPINEINPDIIVGVFQKRNDVVLLRGVENEKHD